MRTLIVILTFLFLLPVISYSSTVTLSGSCGQSVIPSNGHLTFNISNSGNGTASNLLVQPYGAGLRQNATVINEVLPGSSESIGFPVNSVSVPGSYAVNFEVTYDQQGSKFSTLFPCIVNIGTASESLVSDNVSYGSRVLRAKLMSGSNSTINVTATAVLPNGFYTSEPQRNLSIAPYGEKNLSFNVTLPDYGSATLPAAVELSYVYDGLHYAYFSTTSIVFSDKTAPNHSISLLNIAFAAVIAALICLIIISFVFKRKGARNA